MKRLNHLRERRGKVVAKMRSIANAAESNDGGRMTAEQREEFDALKADAAGLNEEIDRELALVEAEEQSRATIPAGLGDVPAAPQSGAQPASNDFRTFGSFLQAVAEAAAPHGQRDPRLMAEPYAAASGLSESVPSDGGFFVRHDMSSEVLQRVYEVGALTSRVRRIPISSNSNGLKINAIDETSRATGSRYGGVQVYWTEEAGEITASKPKFRQIGLELKKCGALVYVTDELLKDAAALQSVAMQAVPEEIAFTVEDAIVNGTGAGQPWGYLNSNAVITVAKETGQPAATFLYENAVKMWSRMWARSRQNAVWLINQDVEPQLFQMSLKVGTGGVPVYLPAGGASGSPYGSLFGRPVIPVEYAQTLGTVGDVQLVDLSQYLMIDKGSVEQASSMHVRFIYDEMVFRFIYRVDGQPVWNSTLTPKNGSNTQSPFIVLATRS